MNGHAILITPQDLMMASVLVVAAGLVSLGLGLGLERRLAIASVRTVVQLLLIGYVLRYIFQAESGWPIAAMLCVMFLAASHASVQRVSRSFRGDLTLTFFTLVVVGLATTYCVTGMVISVEPWYRPQYLIPLLGMVLGNSLTGISLCLDSLLESLSEGREVVEMELAHGATRWEAAQAPIRRAVQKSMIPTLNAMTVVGIVSLPGMMTGQILAGADPLEAVKYQIVVMFMLAAATSVGSVGVAVFSCRVLFNERHQLCGDKKLRSR